MTGYIPKYKIVTRMLLTVFWVLGTYLFPLQEIVPGVAEAIGSYMNLLTEAIIILLGLWTIRSRADWALLISLLVISLISKTVNIMSWSFYINGMRSYLTTIFLLCIIRYLLSTRERIQYFVTLMDRSLYIFLLIQMPVMIIQCIRWGAYDNVGGSLGWMNSGQISTLIYAISFYLMVRRWDNEKPYIQNLKENWILLLALFPSMLNETKISFVYLILYFLLLVPFDRKYFKRMLYVAPLMIIAVAAFGKIYLSLMVNARQDGEIENVMSFDFLSDYVFGNDDVTTLVLDGYMNTVLPEVQEDDFARGLKFAALPIILNDKPYTWWIGFGPSQFRGGSQMELTPFAVQYEWLLRGTQMSAMVFLVDLGIPGLLWLVAYYIVLFRAFRRVRKREKRLSWYMAITVIATTFYIALHILPAFMIVIIYLCMLTSRWPILKYVEKPHGWLLPELPGTLTTYNPQPDNATNPVATTD